MMSRKTIATPPGATIKEQLEDRGMTQKEFAVRMDMTEKHISRLINGEVHLTPDVALRLEHVLGIPAAYWSNLEAIYQGKCTMRLFCEKCRDMREVRVIQKQESYPVKGEDIMIQADVCTCAECGTEMMSIEYDDENLKRAYAIYRERHHLLKPEQIKAIRHRYGISQVSFARMLGLSDKAIARYENGGLQDESINNLILLAENPRNLRS